MWEIGDVVRLTAVNDNPEGDPVDATTVSVSVTQPDGIAVSPAPDPQHPSTGRYWADFPAVQAGRHVVRWVGTGTGAFALSDVVDVWPTDPRYLFDLDRAKGQVGEVVDEDLLRLYIAATTPVIEDITGPLITTQKTRRYDGGVRALLLPQGVSDVTVVESGVTLTSNQFTVDEDAGIVYAGDQLAPREFFPGRQNVAVSFTVGATQIPPNVLMAALEEFRYLWQRSQQGDRPSFGDPEAEDIAYTASGYAVPIAVIQMCAGTRRAAGFA